MKISSHCSVSKVMNLLFFNTSNDLLRYTNSFYHMMPSTEDVYNEDADNIVKNNLREDLQGTHTVPTTDMNGWSWTGLRNINYFLANSGKCPDKAAEAKYKGVAKFLRAAMR